MRCAFHFKIGSFVPCSDSALLNPCLCLSQFRVFWFEIFDSVRKALLVGVPAAFPGRGGNAQLVWGLLVCFITFGAYMMFAPFVKDSDDQLQQMAQGQIFLTLVASIGLRMNRMWKIPARAARKP